MSGIRPPKELRFVDGKTERDIGPITQALFSDVKSGQSHLFVYGDIVYSDAAGCHRQEFCSFFDPSVRTAGPKSTPTGTWMECATHTLETSCNRVN
jgi:hypothetical protein